MTVTAKALLVYLNPGGPDYLISDKLEYGMKRVPKLGFMYLSAVMEKEGVAAVIRDQTLETFSLDSLLSEIRENAYLFVGFYSAAAMKQKVIDYIKAIRKNALSLPILVGGPGFYSGRDYLGAGADIICNGEGERTILEVIQHLKGKRPIDAVKGITYKVDARFMDTPPQGLIENLDELPMPKRTLDKNLTDYYDFHIFNMRLPYTTMISSRGCAYQCTYCSSCNIWGNRIRWRSPANVMGEISYCAEKLGIRYIGFRDDLFGFNYDWLNEFCGLLTRRHYDLLWSCMVHPFSFRKDRSRTLGMLKKAGCDLLIFGLQSAHPGILKNIRRNPQEPAELAETVRAAKALGISTVIEFIFGLPGETEESINTSIRYVQKVRPHYAQFNALSVLEGSELARGSSSRGVSQFSEEEVRARCRYASRRFYADAGLLFQNAGHILKKNPLWFLRIARHSLYLSGYLGFSRIKQTKGQTDE